MLCLVPWLCFTIQIYYLAGGKHWSLGFVCKLAFRLHFYWTLSKVVNSTLNLPTYYLNKMDNMSDAKKLLIYEIIICFAWFHDCVSPFKYITSQEEKLLTGYLNSISISTYQAICQMREIINIWNNNLLCLVPWLCFTIQIYYLAGGKHWSLGFVCKLAFRLHFYWTWSSIVHSTYQGRHLLL